MKKYLTLVLALLFCAVLALATSAYQDKIMPIYNAEAYSAEKSDFANSFALNSYGADDKSMGGTLNAGDYLVYEGVTFDNMKAVMLEASALYTESGKSIELRLDAADGTLVGTFSLVTAAANETADNNYVFKESYITFSGITGTHDVYLVFPAETTLNIDYFVISTYDGNETAEEKADRMSWWSNARYGQFIHWSSFALGKDGNGVACWDITSLHMTPYEYATQVAVNWNPDSWDAEQIVANAQKTGQKYVVLTTRHHNGLSIYDTEIRHFKEYKLGVKNGKPWFMGDETFTSPYDMDVMGDPVKQLSDACYATLADNDPSNDVHFGTYYTIMDWSDKNFDMASNYLAEGGSMGEYKTRLKGQMKELMVDYGTELLWGDGDWLYYVSGEDGIEMYRFARTIMPSVIVNDRVGNRFKGTMGDYATPEQEVTAASRAWESCLTMSAQNEWSYRKSDTFKTAKWALDNIYDCFDNSGNALLNVGPDASGVVPAACMEILYKVGDWLKIYGDSVYGTVGSGMTKSAVISNDNINVTAKDGFLYIRLKAQAEDNTLYVPALENEILSVTDLKDGTTLPYQTLEAGLLIDTTNLSLDEELGGVLAIAVDGFPTESDSSSLGDVTLGMTVTGTNYYSAAAGYDFTKVNDGNSATRWAAADGTTECELVFTSPVPVKANEFTIKMFDNAEITANNRMGQFTVEYYDETNEEWVVAYTVTKNDIAASTTITAEFDEFISTKVRINMPECNGPSIWEFSLSHTDVFELNKNKVEYKISGKTVYTKDVIFGMTTSYAGDIEIPEGFYWTYGDHIITDFSKLIVTTPLTFELVKMVPPEVAMTATASSQYSAAYGAAKAVDGLMDRSYPYQAEGSRWAVADGVKTATLEVTFDRALEVTGFKLEQYVSGGCYIGAYTVDYWNGTEWVAAYTSIGSLYGVKTFSDNFAVSVTANKFRLNITAGNNPSIYEIEFDFAPTSKSVHFVEIIVDGVSTVQIVSDGSNLEAVTTPNKDGYVFAGFMSDGEYVDLANETITENKTYTAIFNRNIATDAIVTASACYNNMASYDGAKACDGNMSTRWATIDGTTAYLELVFDEPMTVGGYKFTGYGNADNPPNSYGYMRTHTVSFEYFDGNEWKVASVDENTDTVNLGKPIMSVSFDEVTATKFRFNVTEGWGPSIWELEVYGREVDAEIGDANFDGKINLIDGIVLARNLASWTGYENVISPLGADVDGDGEVTPADVTVLMRHLAKWAGYETLPCDLQA